MAKARKVSAAMDTYGPKLWNWLQERADLSSAMKADGIDEL